VTHPPAPWRRRFRGQAPGAIARRWRWPGAARLGHLRHPRRWAFGFYLALGLLTAGWYAIRNPTGVCACIGNTSTPRYSSPADPAIFMWSLGWWPHALVHGLNPFVSHYAWAPTGVNLARFTTIPTAALALAPVTALFGPVASYNLMSVASPVLAAFTAYLLCRRIVGRELPALAGGYLFGFGAYQFAQLVNHPNLSLVFLVPVMVHLALRRADREISGRMYVVALAAVLVLQVGLSSEVLATAVALGAVMLVAARFLAPASYGARFGGLLGETSAAGLLAVLVSSPFLYYALVSGGSPHELPFISDAWALDLLNPFFPTHATWLGSHDFQALGLTFEGGNIAEADGYLSVPIILAFLLWAAGTRRRFLARMLLIAAGVSLLAALGSHLHVAGYQTATLPYNWVRSLPVVRLITPTRIAMYISLALAIGVAAWLAERRARSLRGVARWLLFGVGAVMIFPNIGSGLWGGTPENPTFFRGSSYRHYLSAGETLLALPFGADGNSMLWQAETGFYFRMPEGYTGHFVPPQFESQQIVGELSAQEEVNPARLADFLRVYHVSDIVLDAEALNPYAGELARLGLKGVAVGGVLLYHIPPTGL
jgi:hypothetical protein